MAVPPRDFSPCGRTCLKEECEQGKTCKISEEADWITRESVIRLVRKTQCYHARLGGAILGGIGKIGEAYLTWAYLDSPAAAM